MTFAEQIHHLWRQGYDTYEIARRSGETEAAVHREVIRERAARRAAARPWASDHSVPQYRPVLV